MVTAAEVIKHFDMPRATFYWLVKTGAITAHVLPPKDWHRRRQLRFRLSEVAEDLAKIPKPAP